jgi:hypothetical protein
MFLVYDASSIMEDIPCRILQNAFQFVHCEQEEQAFVGSAAQEQTSCRQIVLCRTGFVAST